MQYKFGPEVLDVITETRTHVNNFSFDRAKDSWAGMNEIEVEEEAEVWQK
jgi:hypothetical protein